MVSILGLVFLVVFILVPLVLFIWALIDLLQFDETTWAATGQSKVVWLLVVIFIGVIGPILYLAMARPKLQAIQPG